VKRMIVLSCVVVLLVAAGVVVARANVRGWNGCFHHRWGHWGPAEYLAHQLNLSHAQKQQIRSMWQAERPAVFGLIHEFAAESREMDQVTRNGNLDSDKVQEIATRQGVTLSKLLVEKEHFKAKIYTSVLTPEQRIKADKLESRWYERLDQIGKGME
jgi:Spy/CpxP family protein refolding chaperone